MYCAESEVIMRPLRPEEIRVIRRLLHGKAEADGILSSLASCLVQEMPDGGMGSLEFYSDPEHTDGRRYGRTLATGEFIDKDGVLVSLALYLDSDDRLYQLDSWKVDFSPLLAWADPNEITTEKG